MEMRAIATKYRKLWTAMISLILNEHRVYHESNLKEMRRGKLSCQSSEWGRSACFEN